MERTVPKIATIQAAIDAVNNQIVLKLFKPVIRWETGKLLLLDIRDLEKMLLENIQ